MQLRAVVRREADLGRAQARVEEGRGGYLVGLGLGLEVRVGLGVVVRVGVGVGVG